MGTIDLYKPEKLIAGILLSDLDRLPLVRTRLIQEFGVIDLETGLLPFHYTGYYDAEMGSPIFRTFFTFETLVDPTELARIKCLSNEIEDIFCEEGNRRVNIDPGLLSLERVVLASTKDNGRRIPLRDGIYAEITLIFLFGDYEPLQWTYPDYKSREYRDIMREIRKIYRGQLKHLKQKC
ncbi:MAG: DUF4416 family protein [Spirochaetales bacterium]|jgi:hypothetical protein|nr:DUF4416 family protein [Spirochaetales bacterium]